MGPDSVPAEEERDPGGGAEEEDRGETEAVRSVAGSGEGMGQHDSGERPYVTCERPRVTGE